MVCLAESRGFDGRKIFRVQEIDAGETRFRVFETYSKALEHASALALNGVAMNLSRKTGSS